MQGGIEAMEQASVDRRPVLQMYKRTVRYLVDKQGYLTQSSLPA
jgi:hypothetical protein